MKYRIIFKLAFLSALISLKSIAQESTLKISYKVNDNRSVDFTYNKTDLGTFTVVLNFSNLSNTLTSSGEQTLNVKGYSGNLFTLTPSNKDQGIGFSYNYSYIRGKLKPKYDTDFIYLLPFKGGTHVQAFESNFVNAMYFGNTTPDDWKFYRFNTNHEDTVTAVRKGMVVSVKDIYESNEKVDLAYKSTLNEVVIEHADGTLATYQGFKKGSIVVREGQIVYPGTLLGIDSKYSVNGQYNIALCITYLKSADFESNRNKTLQTTKSLYGFVTPKFYTNENANLVLVPQQYYTAGSTPEILKKELTKKELKIANVK
ncbi:M23 family metallopeptidase [Mucilaginibacter robiniae]|uniref:M23 family metallopeptidase n=1 Tax=Mucilaginibacter robiniae TaxID=2728022 RepID=A0A7L5E2Q8_9SPHI|nr:hypothetical protein [Mucilaginibacter robiniae]QJD96717.1 M23 family metallopeptidase [Mucilaginibacter robiniae]